MNQSSNCLRGEIEELESRRRESEVSSLKVMESRQEVRRLEEEVLRLTASLRNSSSIDLQQLQDERESLKQHLAETEAVIPVRLREVRSVLIS